jgi:hypothetical protein
MFQKFLFLFLLISTLSYAQTNLKAYIPAGDKLDTLTRGDLNKDGIDDIVMVTGAKENDHQTETAHTLTILFGKPDGTFKFHTKSTTAVIPQNKYWYCFFSSISIKKGVLIIEHEYMRGGCTHIFRYQNGGFYLIGASSQSGDAENFGSIEYNLSTGKYISTWESGTSDDKTRKEGTKKPASLPRIEEYELFSVEVDGHSL